MIDGQTGKYTISTLVKSQDEVILYCIVHKNNKTVVKLTFVLTNLLPSKRYIDQGQRTYTFAPVKGTDYR